MKKIHTFLIIFFSICLQTGLQSQQLSSFTLYRDSWTMLNPASLYNSYLINEHTMSAGASYRHQWVDPELKGAPVTEALQFQYVPEDYNFFTGGFLVNDQTGDIGFTGAYGNFAYRLLFSGRVDQSLSIGLNAGVVQYRVKFPIEVLEQVDVINETKIYPDFGLGLFYHYDDKFYAGFSVPQTFGLDLRLRDSDQNEFLLKRVQHYYAVLGGYIDFNFFHSDESSFLEPSIWARWSPFAPLTIDANLRYQVTNLFWVGFGYGTGQPIELGELDPMIIPGRIGKQIIHLEAGIVVGEAFNLDGQLKIGFGYDFQLSEYLKNFGNSFEFHAIYSWEY